MKRSSNKILAGVLACAAFGSTAMATTVTFEGKVIANTCTATINGSAAATLQLNPVSVSALPAVNSMSSAQFFTIDVTACGNHSNHYVKAYFYQTNANAGYLLKDTTDTGVGSGWGYQLTDHTGNSYFGVGNTATVIPSSFATSADVSSGSGALKYGVKYVRTGPLVPGTVKATATYVIYSS